MKNPKRPRDPNQLGKSIIDIATGNAQPDRVKVSLSKKEAASLGGKKRAKNLSGKKRQEIARGAAQSRWRASEKSE
jgi:hypothetical protein